MKIIAKKVKCKHLMPGDLFSTASQQMWDFWEKHEDDDGLVALGQKVYIRTNAPCPDDQKDDDIYRIRIERK